MRPRRAFHVTWIAIFLIVGGTAIYLSLQPSPPPTDMYPGPGLPRRGPPISSPDGIPYLLLNWWAWLLAIVATPLFLVAGRISAGRARWVLWTGLVVALATCSLLTWRLGALRWVGSDVPAADLFVVRRFAVELVPFVLVALAVALVTAHRADVLLRAQAAESRLTALTAQIQPHFLFNTLQAISTALHRDPIRADRMVGALSDLLRGALEGTRSPTVPLARELEILASYLDIVRERFGDRLETIVRVPEELGRLSVPVLLLQPLVENAVRHGVEQREGQATIAINASRDGDKLILMVEDDGIGPDDPRAAGRGRGIGLSNIRERLDTLYGSLASLEIRSLDPGTRVTVRLPATERPA